jgi:hypothetical protein
MPTALVSTVDRKKLNGDSRSHRHRNDLPTPPRWAHVPIPVFWRRICGWNAESGEAPRARQENPGHRILQQRVAMLLKISYLRALQGLAAVLLFVKRLIFARHQFILVAGASTGQKGVNAFANGNHFRVRNDISRSSLVLRTIASSNEAPKAQHAVTGTVLLRVVVF